MQSQNNSHIEFQDQKALGLLRGKVIRYVMKAKEVNEDFPMNLE